MKAPALLFALLLTACTLVDHDLSAYDAMLTEDCRVTAGLELHVQLHSVPTIQTGGDLVTVTYADDAGAVTCTYSKAENRRLSIERGQP